MVGTKQDLGTVKQFQDLSLYAQELGIERIMG